MRLKDEFELNVTLPHEQAFQAIVNGQEIKVHGGGSDISIAIEKFARNTNKKKPNHAVMHGRISEINGRPLFRKLKVKIDSDGKRPPKLSLIQEQPKWLKRKGSRL